MFKTMLSTMLRNKTIVGGLIATVLVVGGVVSWQRRPAPALTPAAGGTLSAADHNNLNNTPVKPAPTANNKTSRSVKSNNAVVVSAAADVRYEAAMEKYDYRLQFSQCHGLVIPGNGTIALKQGSAVMLDNRDNVSHVIGLAGRSYTVSAYGFAVVYPRTIGKLMVTCDGKGAAQLLVQA